MKYILIVLILISTNVSALGTKVYTISGMTLGANIVNVKVRVLDIKYIKYLAPYIASETRDGIAVVHIEHYYSMCMAIAQRLRRLSIPVTEITITPIKDVPGLGWKSKTCQVPLPEVKITVD